ncbi:MAG: amidohydrolase/deacetylase family metallohydrolase [Flavobacteriaceae bacterium]|nr:amidohydrolase/deacetylase family metallohydrolase [Flavobacteriia bacterium]
MKHFLNLNLGIAFMFFSSALAQDYDMLIQNGHLIDAKNGINEVMDIAIKDGKIAAVSSKLNSKQSKKTIDAKGLVISPGLIDIHGHHFHGTEPSSYLSNSFTALPPDGFTFESGITTVVDVGGAGWRNFNQFKEQTIANSKTRVLSFLNIVGHGMKGGAFEQDLNDMDEKLTAIVAQQNKDYVVGIKVAHFSGFDWTPVEKAVAAGSRANIPVMVDFGGSQPELPLNVLLLEKLRPGDIFTHAYAHVNGRTPVVNESGKLQPYVLDAQKRGIIFDVGHGGGSFVFEQAIPAIQQGFKPNTISTDLHTGSMNGGMKDILNVMSKLLNMDMSIQELVEAATWKPAKVIQREDLGNLSVGSVADITLLKIESGEFGFIDTQNKKMEGTKKIICELTLREGNVVYDLNGLASTPWNN